MKVLSISDVITNSSSEVFCTITADNHKTLKEIYDAIGNLGASDDGDGGTYLDDDYITVSFAHGSWFDGLDMLFKPGIEKILEPWEGKYKIDYEKW